MFKDKRYRGRVYPLVYDLVYELTYTLTGDVSAEADYYFLTSNNKWLFTANGLAFKAAETEVTYFTTINNLYFTTSDSKEFIVTGA